VSAVERIPSAAFSRMGRLGRWATDGACMIREDCPPPLVAVRGLHPTGYFADGGWRSWKSRRIPTASICAALASVEPADSMGAFILVFAPRFARVLRAGAPRLVAVRFKVGEPLVVCAGVYRDKTLIAIIMPARPETGASRHAYARRVDLYGWPVVSA
jgi:hypothetical protein